MDPTNPLDQTIEQARASAAIIEDTKQIAEALKLEIEQAKIEVLSSKADAMATNEAIKTLLEKVNGLSSQAEASLAIVQSSAQNSTSKI